jgi:hypothetical protein
MEVHGRRGALGVKVSHGGEHYYNMRIENLQTNSSANFG